KKESSAPTGLPVRGSRIPLDAGATILMGSLIPFQRPLLPFIYEPDGEDAKEHHHRPEAEKTDLAEDDRPGKQEGHFKVENDEENGNEVEAHIEFHARVIERVEAALAGGEFFGIRLPIRDDERGDQQRKADAERDSDEDNQRQVVQQQSAHRRPQACSPRFT